jgi:Hint module
MCVRTGDALVITEGSVFWRMDQLVIGDRVQTVDSAWLVWYDDIFVFGHRDRNAVAYFVHLELQALANGARAFIQASHDHFVPTGDDAVNMPNVTRPHWRTERRMLRAVDVAVGQIVWVVIGRIEPAQVTGVSRVTKRGLYNPYTASGTVVVNGVVASVHSRWVLDDLFDYFDASHWLPAAYQVVFVPIRGVYGLVKLIGGPGLAQAIDDTLILSHLAHRYPYSFFGANVGLFLLFAVIRINAFFGR